MSPGSSRSPRRSTSRSPAGAAAPIATMRDPAMRNEVVPLPMSALKKVMPADMSGSSLARPYDQHDRHSMPLPIGAFRPRKSFIQLDPHADLPARLDAHAGGSQRVLLASQVIGLVGDRPLEVGRIPEG